MGTDGDTSEGVTKASLAEAFLARVQQKEKEFRGEPLPGANLAGEDLTGGLDLTEANLENADLSSAKLRKARLDRAHLESANLKGALLGAGTHLHGALCENANFDGADLSSAYCIDANMSGATLRGTDLRGTRLENANLTDADLTGARFDTNTQLQNATVTRCRITRHQLETLGDYGGLSKGARMVMDIEDGAATLRASYSGFWSWVHVIALLIFVAPYVTFVAQSYWEVGPLPWQLAQAQCAEPAACRTLGSLLWEFVWSGGRFDGQVAWVPFLIFWYSLIYNGLRAVLLWKTKKLELQEEASGLPPDFTLQGSPWGRTLTTATWMFYGNVLLVVIHALHFLQVRVPAPG